MEHEDYMHAAVRVAQEGIAAGQTPFGAVIVRDGSVVSEGHNCVWLTGDPTAHAEVVTIRKAAGALRTIDLSGSVMYTTCEPCPMCLSAIHWSKLDAVYYGPPSPTRRPPGSASCVSGRRCWLRWAVVRCASRKDRSEWSASICSLSGRLPDCRNRIDGRPPCSRLRPPCPR